MLASFLVGNGAALGIVYSFPLSLPNRILEIAVACLVAAVLLGLTALGRWRALLGSLPVLIIAAIIVYLATMPSVSVVVLVRNQSVSPLKVLVVNMRRPINTEVCVPGRSERLHVLWSGEQSGDFPAQDYIILAVTENARILVARGLTEFRNHSVIDLCVIDGNEGPKASISAQDSGEG
jgi:hypothetical protein